MNDNQIRKSFHRKHLGLHHRNPGTVVVDELGLKHGRCRADIAVINGYLSGYEIKSDQDTLDRLPGQVGIYSSVFDRASVIVAERHVAVATELIPSWWGLFVVRLGPRGGTVFERARKPEMNGAVDPISVAQLLWRDEAAAILEEMGADRRTLRSPRKVLYECLATELRLVDLRKKVRAFLKGRTMWRSPGPQPPDGDWSLSSAKY